MLNLIAGGFSAAFLLADFIYHRFNEDKPLVRLRPYEIPIPRTDEGAPVPLITGRCLVRSPILAWARVTNLNGDTSANVQMLFVLGIGMDDGNGINRVHGMKIGDSWVAATGAVDVNGKWTQTGIGAAEVPVSVAGRGRVETLNGNATQVLANDGDTTFPGAQPAPTWAGRMMIEAGIPHAQISGYRGYVCVFLHDIGSAWLMSQGSEPAYAFETSSYRDGGGYPAVGIYAQIGQDGNPINHLYDLLKAKFGKLGLSTALIDLPSWQSAAITVYNEANGYSACIDESRAGDDHIMDVLRQVDGAIDEDPTTGLVKIKLIRPDFDPNTIPHITSQNSDGIANFAAGGWANVVNRLRLGYISRERGYAEDSEPAFNRGNATAQGHSEEQLIEMRGVHFASLAKVLADRELAARSRPLMKFRVYLGREFLTLMRGDAVKVTLTNPDIAGLIFRVADVDRGTIEDGKIAVDLIQDYYYVWRNLPPQPGWLNDLNDLSMLEP